VILCIFKEIFMLITKDKVVAIDYCLKNSAGDVLDSSQDSEPLEYLHGHNSMIPGLEKELEGKKDNDSFKVVVNPEDGYGVYDANLQMIVPRENFPEGVEISVGSQFEAESPGGPIPVLVTNVTDEHITVDANHPLAGEKLFFDIKVISVRDATADEIENGLEDCCGHDDCEGDCCDCH
jgi:FKBP-type peptidyl-prolyl cis-trans isomerase SlyD